MKKRLTVFLLVALLAAAGLGGWYVWHQNYVRTHVFVGEAVYERNARSLDLRGEALSPEDYEALHQELPFCDILWDVPFQGKTYSSDTAAIAVEDLSMEDLAQLDYLPNLTQVDASGCQDYAALAALKQRRPELVVRYTVTIGGENYDPEVTALAFDDVDGAELLEKLKYLPKLEKLDLGQTQLEAGTLLALREAYPNLSIYWEKSVLGQTFPNTVTELDFSGMDLGPLEQLEADMAYFPDLTKLILCDCGIDNETMAAFRERARENYKVVWRVSMGKWNGLTVRTDETTFMPRKVHVNMQNEQMKNLRYCEDMIVVDVGHMGLITDLDWLYGMPKLQFLVLVGTGVSDLTPIGTLKELKYLELFKCPDIRDYSPLVGCTALEDVNLAYTNGDSSVFADMPWLKHLWINGTNVPDDTRALLTEKLPDTVIEFDHGWHMGNGWRDLPNYYVMRDLLDMPYYAWGGEGTG